MMNTSSQLRKMKRKRVSVPSMKLMREKTEFQFHEKNSYSQMFNEYSFSLFQGFQFLASKDVRTNLARLLCDIANKNEDVFSWIEVCNRSSTYH